jgi:hypothetical protein
MNEFIQILPRFLGTSLPDVEQLEGPIAEQTPGMRQCDHFFTGSLVERLGPTAVIDLDELHNSIHPWGVAIKQGGAPQRDDDLGAATMDLAAADLNDLADGDGLIAAKIEHPLQDEIRIQAGGAEGRGITGLEGQGKQGTGVERSVMIGVPRQNQVMGQCFGVLGGYH